MSSFSASLFDLILLILFKTLDLIFFPKFEIQLGNFISFNDSFTAYHQANVEQLSDTRPVSREESMLAFLPAYLKDNPQLFDPDKVGIPDETFGRIFGD